MEKKYDDVIADFQIYLDVDSKKYWTIVEMVNDELQIPAHLTTHSAKN